MPRCGRRTTRLTASATRARGRKRNDAVQDGAAVNSRSRRSDPHAAGGETDGGDTVEFGLLAGGDVRLLPCLVALIQHLDLLQFLERLAERGLRLVELSLELAGRAAKILTPVDRRLGIGRIGEVTGVVNAGAVLLDLDLAVELGRDAVEFSDHGLDLRHLAALLVDLKLLQADEGFA